MSSARLPVLREIHRRPARHLGRRIRRPAPHGAGEAAAREAGDGAEPQGAFGGVALAPTATRTCCSTSIPTTPSSSTPWCACRGAPAACTTTPTPGCSTACSTAPRASNATSASTTAAGPATPRSSSPRSRPARQGKVDLVPPHAIHAEQGGPTRSVAIIVRSQKLGEGTVLQRTLRSEARTP